MFTFRLAAAASAAAAVIIILNVAILATTTTTKLTLWRREFSSERFFFGGMRNSALQYPFARLTNNGVTKCGLTNDCFTLDRKEGKGRKGKARDKKLVKDRRKLAQQQKQQLIKRRGDSAVVEKSKNEKIW